MGFHVRLGTGPGYEPVLEDRQRVRRRRSRGGAVRAHTREANRANTTIYTIDPRGLVGGPDIDQTTLDTADWQDHIRETQSSLRVIAELTGGIPVVNTNDFTKALKRIDAETSDYYVLGYNSSNADPLKKRRTIEIRVKQRPKLQLTYKTSHTLKPAVTPPKRRKLQGWLGPTPVRSPTPDYRFFCLTIFRSAFAPILPWRFTSRRPRSSCCVAWNACSPWSLR